MMMWHCNDERVRMKRLIPVQAGMLVLAACTGTSPNRSPPRNSDGAKVTVVPAEHHDVSPPLSEIPPAPRPADDMKREIPIHRLPLPPGY
jgi:hypothetical protein